MTVVTDPTTFTFLPSGETVVSGAVQTTTTGTGQNTQVTINSYGAVNQGGSAEDQNLAPGLSTNIIGYKITIIPQNPTTPIVVNTTGLPVADLNPLDVGGWVNFQILHQDPTLDTASVIDQILAIGNNGMVLSNNGGVLGTLVTTQTAIEGALPSNGQDIVLSTLNLDYFDPITGLPTNPDANGNALAPVGAFTIGGPGPACFVHGTMIATPNGDVAVETLNVGDTILLADGETAPIHWIGRLTIKCDRHASPESVWPVRIAADAFGPALPRQDLYLSGDHAVFIDGVLVPARLLCNGATITPIPRETVTYFHVELDRHAILLANDLPCESFLETGNERAKFGGEQTTVLHPDFTAFAREAEGCAPFVVTGKLFDAIRAQLSRRAAEMDAIVCAA